MAEEGIIGKASDKIKELEQSLNKLKQPVAELHGMLKNVVDVAESIASTVRPFTQVQKAAAELATSVGLSSKSIMATATRTIEQNHKMQLSMSYNISSAEMIKLQGAMMSKLQRNVAIDQVGTVQKNANGDVVNPNFDSDLENLIAASKVFGEEHVGNIVAGFDKLGMSMKSAAKATGKLYKEAGEYGINLQKYTENFTSNLQMAQMYNFRNGVNGLKEMARKATEIRQDMKQIASFADKVGSVTGAVETAANLQVLGGSFAALSNPLAMLNESLTDMNGLQDRFNQMTQGAATYNSVTHQIEMDPVTRQLMKRAAESMGVDPNNFIDQAYAQARQTEIKRQIDLNGIGGIRDDVLKMLPNIGEIDSETGVAGATIGGQFRSLAEIASMPDLQDQLIEETRSESEDIKVIAKSVMTIEEKVAGYKSQAENAQARNALRPGAVSGLSAYEMASKMINEDFNPSVLEAAHNVDLFTDSLTAFGQMLLGKGVITEAKSADSIIQNINNPEKAKEELKEHFKYLFGDSDLSNTIGSIVGSVGEAVAGAIGKVNNFTVQQANFTLAPGNDKTAMQGQAGRTGELTVPAAPTATPATSTGTEVLSAQEYANNILRSFMPMYPILPQGVNFVGTQQSIPGVTVTPTTNGQTQAAVKGQQGGTNGTYSYNLNLSGNLTMDINGDNGKIGTADVMKLLENNPNFAREVAKAISESLTKMYGAGMIQNP